MTQINWINVGILIALILVFSLTIHWMAQKATDYEGICGINHGDEDINSHTYHL